MFVSKTGRLGGTALAIALLTGAPDVTAQRPGPAIQVEVRMPDGIALVTEVYLPDSAGAHPSVLYRTPYGTRERADQAEWFTARGYAVVLQNVRGTGGSGGTFLPLVHERADGLATLDWMTAQPWSDGQVVLWGPSYSGNAAFLLAATGHPAVVAMAHLSGWADNGSFLYRGGAFQLLAQLPWIVQFALGDSPSPDMWDGLFRTTPISAIFGPLQEIRDALLTPFPYENVRVPVLHLTGFHDYVYRNAIEAYTRIRESSGGRVEQELVIGPWWHNQIWMSV
jgi:predicted acyl esterase